MRTCGMCHLCCIAVKVVALDKPAGVPCPHLNVLQDCGACGIYANRPSECAVYTCSWIDGSLHEDLKPETCGILLETARIDWPRPLKILMGFEEKPGAIYHYWEQIQASAVSGTVIGIVPHAESPYNDVGVCMFGEPEDAATWQKFMKAARRSGGITHQFADGTVEQIVENE